MASAEVSVEKVKSICSITRANIKEERDIVEEMRKKDKHLEYLDLAKGGKGYAVIEGFKKAIKNDFDLIGFVNTGRKEIDALILAGLFHKQLVLIHPFMDGNGRTTRLATKVLLSEMGLDTFNLFSFENYYNRNVTKYFENVGEIGNYYDLVSYGIDFTPWLEYFTEGIIDELLRVQKLLPKVGISPKSELLSYHLNVLDFISRKGFITDKDYAKLTNRAKATRTIDFQKLIELGLIERKGKGRATYYVLKGK